MRLRRQAAVEEVDYRATCRSGTSLRTCNLRYGTISHLRPDRSQIIVPGYNEHGCSMRLPDDRGEFANGAAGPRCGRSWPSCCHSASGNRVDEEAKR